MNLTGLEFVFDENIPIGLSKIFQRLEIKWKSVQNLGWSGIEDKAIAEKLANSRKILITRDKDFQFLWEKYNLRVIHLMIEPATLKYISPIVDELFIQWDFDPSSPSLIIVQNESIRIRRKIGNK
jgi:predicted nuclease of predicted toxin-antitoxin system